MKGLSGNTHRIAWRGLLASVLVAICVAQAAAQPAASRIYDEQLRVKLDNLDPETREDKVDVGGWLNIAFFDYDDATARTERQMRQYELRAWASMNLRGVHKFYVRGLASLDDWSGNRSDEWGTEIERAWYEVDLGKLLENHSGRRPPIGVRIKLGRDFMSIGTALVLSTTLDMARAEVTIGDWELMGFIGHTLRDSWNIDNSPAVANRQQRWISGFQATYLGFNRHRPFVYFMHNDDNTDPSGSIAGPGQKYEYNSDYIGMGSTGTLCLPNLRYSVEGVAELGRTYSSGSFPDGFEPGQSDRIQAWAVNAVLEYLFVDCPTKPRVGFEYLFATGDSDRSTAPIGTDGGNRAGTLDRGFGGFGFRDLGIAFSPEISNIHVYAINASFFPLEHIEMFEAMELGTKLFFYSRAHGSAPISDPTTTSEAQSTGFEMDFFCNWRMTSDVALTVRYGSFFPGNAYDGGDKSARQFLYGGLVFSF
ncbi:MAG: alginate export family protein [Phycisphaerae bacterium]|jgi:hypothetical protein|nr:alginate export family protein [Phycisphaerae bacterium]